MNSFLKQQAEKTKALIEKFGRTLWLEKNGQKEEFKGLLQPLRYKNKMYLSSVSTDLSYDSTGKYLLICPCEPDISEADGYAAIIGDSKKKYVADRAETIYLGSQPIYCWAIVTALGNEN